LPLERRQLTRRRTIVLLSGGQLGYGSRTFYTCLSASTADNLARVAPQRASSSSACSDAEPGSAEYVRSESPGSAGKFERLEREGQIAYQRMVELLGTGAMELDIVCSPSHAELVAPRGQLADEVGQGAVVRVAACLGTQDGHGVPSGLLPIDP